MACLRSGSNDLQSSHFTLLSTACAHKHNVCLLCLVGKTLDFADYLSSICPALRVCRQRADRGKLLAGSKLIFRFEPFILAVECRDMVTAQQLVAVAREAGFRESGVTATKARTIAGIRCSLRLEVSLLLCSGRIVTICSSFCIVARHIRSIGTA